jgi:glucose/arabinose dehydrogenase
MRLAPPLLVALAFAACGGEDSPDRGSSTPARTGLEVRTIAEGLDTPWDIAFLPDRRALVTERPGQVRLLSAEGELAPDPVADVEVVESDGAESGLLGIAVDPDYEENAFVYLYRTVGEGNEVARYRVENDRLVEDGVVVRGIEAGAIHNGGRVAFGPDGRLYITTGEAGQADLAQQDGLNGKVLVTDRFREDGVRPDVLTTGHRNVQGLDWEPGTDRLLATEFGPDSDDEVNVLRAGANYGWPEAQGDEGGVGFERPLVNYEDVIAPSGATFVSRDGSAWTGSFVFANLLGEHLRRLSFDGERVSDEEVLLEGEYGRLRSVVEGPDGALYVLTSNRDGRGDPGESDDRILRLTPPS